MADNGNQGNGGQGQESGTGAQGQGQESASQQGQNGNQSGQQGQESGQGGQQGNQEGPDFAKMSETELREYAARTHKELGITRSEAGKYRTQFQEAQGKLTEAERAKMSDQEKLQTDLTTAQGRVTELEAQVEDLTRGSAVRDALATAGAINPSTAYKVGDWSKVKLDADGTVNHDSFKAVLDQLRKSDPYLFKRTADAGAGEGRDSAPQGSGGGINAYIRGGRQ